MDDRVSGQDVATGAWVWVTANAVDPENETGVYEFLARVEYYVAKDFTYWLTYYLRGMRLFNSFNRDEFVPHEPTEAELASWLERVLTE